MIDNTVLTRWRIDTWCSVVVVGGGGWLIKQERNVLSVRNSKDPDGGAFGSERDGYLYYNFMANHLKINVTERLYGSSCTSFGHYLLPYCFRSTLIVTVLYFRNVQICRRQTN